MPQWAVNQPRSRAQSNPNRKEVPSLTTIKTATKNQREKFIPSTWEVNCTRISSFGYNKLCCKHISVFNYACFGSCASEGARRMEASMNWIVAEAISNRRRVRNIFSPDFRGLLEAQKSELLWREIHFSVELSSPSSPVTNPQPLLFPLYLSALSSASSLLSFFSSSWLAEEIVLQCKTWKPPAWQ